MIVAFAKLFHWTVLRVDADTAAGMDAEHIRAAAVEFLKPYRTVAFKTFADAAHLSDFRRTKELVHEVTAQLDANVANDLAITTSKAAVEEFPAVFGELYLQGLSRQEYVQVVCRRALDWLHEVGLFDVVAPFVADQTVSAQLRFKRVVLEIRRATKGGLKKVRSSSDDASTTASEEEEQKRKTVRFDDHVTVCAP